jgi:hypothetical protein
MAKHNSVTLGFDDCAQKTIPVVEPVRSGVKTRLSQWTTMFDRLYRQTAPAAIRGQLYTPQVS